MNDLLPNDGPPQALTDPGAVPDRLLDDVFVCWMTNLPRSTVIRMIGEGTFPAPVMTGKAGHAWKLSDVLRWIDSLESVPHLRRRA